MAESTKIDYKKVIFDFFKSCENLDELNCNIFDFFQKYPTKDTYKLPDGTIINMQPDEPVVDKNHDHLPLLNGIPQGEESTRIIVLNIDSGMLIASPPGIKNTYFITRYGSPFPNNTCRNYNNYSIEKFDELRNIMSNMSNNNCFCNKFKCDDSDIKKIIAADYDSYLNSCEKHKNIIKGLIYINVAGLNDIKLFCNDYMVLNHTLNKCNSKKGHLLKRIQIVLKLAEMGKLRTRQLDPDFKLEGIHYYYYCVNKERLYSWVLLYHNSNNKIAHIYLNELTDDIEVKKVLELIAYEIITAKHHNDLDTVKTFLRYQKKAQYTMLENLLKKPYKINIDSIIEHKII